MTTETPESIVGPFHDLLKNHYLEAMKYKGFETIDFDKKMKSFGAENREKCALLYDKLYLHGFFVDGVKGDRLVYGMAIREPYRAAIYPEKGEDKRTPVNVGKKRMLIIQKLMNNEISREDAEYYQSLSDDKVMGINGGLEPTRH
jgi:hypothetical protein